MISDELEFLKMWIWDRWWWLVRERDVDRVIGIIPLFANLLEVEWEEEDQKSSTESLSSCFC